MMIYREGGGGQAEIANLHSKLASLILAEIANLHSKLETSRRIMGDRSAQVDAKLLAGLAPCLLTLANDKVPNVVCVAIDAICG